MLNKNDLLDGLANHYCTNAYHRFSILFPNVLLTDGAKYLADKAECYWLFDIVGSVIKTVANVRLQDFLVVEFTKGNKNLVVIEDGNGKVLYQQEIVYTDFPLQEYSFFVSPDHQGHHICLLKSEY